MTTLDLGFIGTGRIARALIAALHTNPEIRITGFDRDPATLHGIVTEFGINAVHSVAAIGEACRVMILAVKPYQIAEVAVELRPVLRPDHLLISVAAGISSTYIEQQAETDAGLKVIRAMPNTPALIGEGMIALACGTHATAADRECAAMLFRPAGRVLFVEEQQMDAVTALSGSGPAYMFHILDALADAGKACGLSYDDALLLATQTMLGAARMMQSGTKSPAELEREVTTPGGTTEAGLRAMDAGNIRALMNETVAAAARRAKELML